MFSLALAPQADVFNLIGDRNVIRVFGALFPFLCFREPVVTPLNIGLRFLMTYRSFRAARNVVIHFRGHFGVSKMIATCLDHLPFPFGEPSSKEIAIPTRRKL